MKLGWGIATSCLIGLFGVALWLAVWGAASLNSRPLAMRDALGPGPGFFPVWLSIIGLGLGAVLLLQVARQPAQSDAPSLIPERAACARIVAILALLAVAALALDPLGFRIASFVFSLLALVALGIRSPVRILAFALAASIGIFHVFYYWLKVPLPIGPFDYVLKPLGL